MLEKTIIKSQKTCLVFVDCYWLFFFFKHRSPHWMNKSGRKREKDVKIKGTNEDKLMGLNDVIYCTFRGHYEHCEVQAEHYVREHRFLHLKHQ